MRPYPLAVLCLLASQPVLAISFQTRLEKIEWQVEGDQFECRLSQPITDFGSGVFVRRAGEQVTFRLQARERWAFDVEARGGEILRVAAIGDGDTNIDLTVRDVRYNSQGYPLITSTMQEERFRTATMARNWARDNFNAKAGQYASK